jgi:hypothetical protein
MGQNQNTFEIWRGDSLIDASEIMVLVSGFHQRSENAKTLDMMQTWIVRTDISPLEASKLGLDYAICGDCQIRKFLARIRKDNAEINNISCYVDLARGVGGTWTSWSNGNIDQITPLEASEKISQLKQCECAKVHRRSNDCSNKPLGLRQGSYGDPASVPPWVWADLLSMLGKAKTTSYTHRWETQDLQETSMASIDPQTYPDVNDALDRAHARGYRTYRVLPKGEALRPDEMLCPEAENKTNCANCGLCSGMRRPNTPNIAIPAIS